MSEKEKKQEAMKKLMSGLTGPSPAPSPATRNPDADEEQDFSASEKPKPKGKRGRPPRSNQWSAKCFVVNNEKYGKVRVIAQQTGLQIKDIVDNALDDYIKKVEKKNGVIRIPKKTIELPDPDE